MNVSLASWIVLLTALTAANLPFVNDRVFGLIPFPHAKTKKSIWWRVAELAALYIGVGLLGRAFDKHIGTVYPQNWEFYAISAVVFLVFAYPGFAYCYLSKRRRDSSTQ